MKNIIEITDYSAPEIDVYVRLTGAQLRRGIENERGVFIAESPMVIEVALNAGLKPISLLTDKKLLDASAKSIIERVGNVPIYTAEGELLKKLTGFELTRGALAAFERPEFKTIEKVTKGAKRIAVLEQITDSTNVGAIFRSAAALNIDAVLVTPTCCDPLCRRAVRVSMGTVLCVPWTRIGATPSDWPEKGLALLNSLGFKTVAMALSDDSVSIDDPRLTSEEKLAIILGTEGDGLAKSTVANCDYTAKIPMSNGVDSLNVAAAGAVAFWQLRKKRDSEN